jgi:1,4-alpha-glucan branching enzyme
MNNGFVDRDPWLEPYRPTLEARLGRYRHWKTGLDEQGGLTGEVSTGHRHFGIQMDCDGAATYREWAPSAHALSLIGDFNGWNCETHRLEPIGDGVWTVSVPAGVIRPGGRVKVRVFSNDPPRDRIPAWIRQIDHADNGDVAGVVARPSAPPAPLEIDQRQRAPRIYEAHVGVATEEGTIGTWRRFADEHLERIAALGYNTVQLMAVHEHPYFASFGYHVSSFFAPSARFGTPADLKYLIQKAHALELAVWMDVVHSHAITNVREGLNRFDGSGGHYFHEGPRGYHPLWDSRLFDYAKPDVQRFLLSNLRYWIEEFGFDGFRFDGVTSMLYRDHGIGRSFGDAESYFGELVDADALLYLQAANDLCHCLRPDFVTVAEDVSGMPGLARPIDEGGIGFDYRLAMGAPDAWIRWIRHSRDEQWDVGEIAAELTRRRPDEAHVGYAESHDQSIVGDQALSFRLMGAAMYDAMAVGTNDVRIDRGIALHKLIRLLTFFLAGDAWLNFMGNEFGHPEWVDLPREGNGWSMHYARRQWSLATDPKLRYRGLLEFDRALMRLDDTPGLLRSGSPEILLADRQRQVLVASRGPNTLVVNLAPESSYDGLVVPVAGAVDQVEWLNSDDTEFGGHGRGANPAGFAWFPSENKTPSVRLYLPNRTGLVLGPRPVG